MPPPPSPTLRGLVPPSHFVLRPPSARTLEAELEAERGRGQSLEAELEAERRRGQSLEAELEVERRRGQSLEAELEAERGRGQSLEAELEAERGRGQSLEAELEAERGRGQSLEAELEAERGRGHALGQILALQEQELGRELPPEEVGVALAPPRLRALLGRWRDKAFALLVQLRAQDQAERGLRAQVAALGAAVAAGTRRVRRLELRLRQEQDGAELRRRDSQRLARELAQQRGRAEAAEEALRGLAQLATRLAAAVAAREAEVTAATGAIVTLSARLRRAGRRLRGLVAAVSPPRRRHPHAEEATPRQDGPGHPPGRAALGSLVTQLQALGAAILGDSGDPPGPP